MATTLYDITVPVFRRGLGVLGRVLGKGRELADAEGIDLAALLEARLAPDMLTLVGHSDAYLAKSTRCRLGCLKKLWGGGP